MKYNFQVYATQGGGLAREIEGVFVFVEVPKWGNWTVGDVVPEEWDIVPITLSE